MHSLFKRYLVLLTAVLTVVSCWSAPAKPKKTFTMAEAMALAEKAMNVYDVDLVEEMLDHYRQAMSKNKKATEADHQKLEEMEQQLSLTSNMLDRVEKIAIVDSLSVDSADFFRYYRLAPEVGSISGVTKKTGSSINIKSAYATEDGTHMVWSEMGPEGKLILKEAEILLDGTLENPKTIETEFSGVANVDYPFLMSDGITLYFASDGEGSLGGYDIYMTRRNDDGWYQPQNLGMPYNSPYDDYMLAIDEVTGAGWFATNRNSESGKITIYIFVPNSVRSNYSTDEPNLASLAMLSDLSFLPAGTSSGVPQVLENLSLLRERMNQSAPTEEEFMFAIPGKGVLTSLDQFKNRQARSMMQQYLKKEAELQSMEDHLNTMRRDFRLGNNNLSTEIIQMEKRIESGKDALLQLSNQIINMESKK